MNYNWKRFWVKIGNPVLLDHEGYLNANISGEKSNLLSFESISIYSCLILLGEPGIGKSYCLEDEVNKLTNQLSTVSDDVRLIDLKHIYNRNDLDDEIFQQNFFLEWVNSKYKLNLFLDSFDESFIQYPSLINMFMKKLKHYKEHVHRLTLRIASRNGPWIMSLKSQLKELWGNDKLEIYQLAPLQRIDVISAIQVKDNIPEKIFLEEIKTKNLAALASKPVTLNFLIKNFKEGVGFPESKIDIYRLGCHILCDEVNEDRRAKKNFLGVISEAKRFELASRIAFITILCNKNVINTETVLRTDAINEVLLSDIKNASNKIDNSDIEEVLSTSLFIVSGKERVSWSHLTYAEFLAAHYINEHYSTEQTFNILFHPQSYQKKIVPQLHGVASWLAGMNEKVFNKILETDFNVLFLTDFFKISDKQKEKLINSFLKIKDSEILYYFYANYHIYKYLMHKNIEKQLHDLLNSQMVGEKIGCIAIEIALQCNLKNLKDDFLNLALNSWGRIQDKAIYAYIKYSSGNDLVNLKGLLTKITNVDDGTVVFVLEKLKEKNYIHSNDILMSLVNFNLNQTSDEERFLNFFKKFTSDEVMDSIIWSIKEYKNNQSRNYFEFMVDIIILFAIELLSNSKIKKYLEKLIVKRYEISHKILISVNLYSIRSYLNERKRHKLILFLSNLVIKYKNPNLIDESLILSSDKDWLQSNINDETIPCLSNRIQELINQKTLRDNSKIYVPLKNPKLVYEAILNINLSNKKVVRSWMEFCKSKIFRSENNLLFSDNEEIQLLFIDDCSTKILLKAAYKFIMLYTLKDEDWNNSLYSDNVRAAEKAFSVLFEKNLGQLKDLPTIIWKKWAPIIIYCPYSRINGDRWNNNILKLAVEIKREVFIDEFIAMLDTMESIKYLVDSFCDSCFGSDIAERIMIKIQASLDFEFTKFGPALGILLSKNYRPAYNFANSLIKLPISNEPLLREKSKTAIIQLMGKAKDIGWKNIWNAIANNEKFGCEVVHGFIHTDNVYIDNVIFNHSLRCSELKDFYLWLYVNITEDKQYAFDLYTVNEWRTGILKELRDRESSESYHAIKIISETFPDDNDAKKMWHFVYNDYLRKTWNPNRPEILMELSQNKDRRFVETEDELMEVLIESLDRIQRTLQGETPTAPFLWNKNSDGIQPKDETDFTDFIKWRLTDDLMERGVIANREVEIRKGYGVGKGEITDILVQAITKNSTEGYKKLSLIIEVKGCWHSKIKSAMETQLVNRYLKENQCKNGIYLIGWFYCPQWKKSRVSIESARQKYDEQAMNLSEKNNLNIRSYIMNTSLRS